MDEMLKLTTISCCQELCDYAQQLVGGITDSDMIAQPVPGVVMNHPAWILSHLAAYAPVVSAILKNEPAIDPLDHPFGRNSEPLDDAGVYLPKDKLIAHYLRVHEEALDAFRAVSMHRLAEMTPIERWQGRFPTIASLPEQFFVKHHATHLGQLSAFRRAAGLGRV